MTEFYAKFEHEIFIPPNAGLILRDIQNYLKGNGTLRQTLRMYFDRLRWSYTRKDSKYTPMQVLMDEGLLEQLWQRVESKPDLFPEGRNTVRSFQTAIGVGWSKCRSVANFPVKEARKVYEKYCPVGGLIYDPSAGFGARMSAALLGGWSYVATDPNKDLYPILNEYHSMLIESEFVSPSQYFSVYCQGSEEFIPELEGKVDFAFTSPPYFNLEKYSDDEGASTKHYNNFAAWGRHYVIPTIRNIRSYLKSGAKVCINIKNLHSGEKLYDKWCEVFRKIGGFKELDPHVVNINRRHYGNGKGVTLEEKLKEFYRYGDTEQSMVFEKL